MQNLKQVVADLLDDEHDSLASKWVDRFIIFTIILTVVSIILESEPALHQQYRETFLSIEYFSVAVFTVEYLLRLWSAPRSREGKRMTPAKARKSYVFSFHAIIDLLAILPLILSLLSIDLRFLRAVRLLRIFKLTRYNSAMNTLISVFKRESKAFLSVIFVLFIVLIISSSCIYIIEHKAQPETFGSILKSMWWSIVTLSTVGYGDVSPITPLGKFFGGIIITVGIGLMALPAGLLASAFSEQLHKTKSDYRSAVKRAIDDGIITPEEHRLLRKLQEKYDITDEEAEDMIQEQLSVMSQKAQHKTLEHHCPHCGKRFIE